MITDLLEKLELMREVQLTRINHAPAEGPDLVMDAELRIGYPGGRNEKTNVVLGIIGSLVNFGYVVERKSGDKIEYICRLRKTIDVEAI